MTITPEGLVDFPGIVTSKGTMVVARKGEFIAIKSPGRHYYSNRISPWSYAPGEYEVYRIVSTHDAGDRESLVVEKLLDFPLRSNSPFTGGTE